jgi:hypothetical protein
MACGAITTLALSAVLLGQQKLKVENRRQDETITVCEAPDATNANAIVKLKDSSGRVVFARRIHVSQIDFYTSSKRRGAFPAKTTTLLVSYPQTERTQAATTVELASFDGTFARRAKIPAVKVDPVMRFK